MWCLCLLKVIEKPKERSTKWVSSSVKESEWDSEKARFCSVSYHVHNFLNPVRFHEALLHIPQGAVVIELATHSLLQSIMKRSKSYNSWSAVVSLMMRDQDGLAFFLSGCGRYEYISMIIHIEGPGSLECNTKFYYQSRQLSSNEYCMLSL